MENKAANFKFYALVTNESTDAMVTAELAVFIRDIDNEYNVSDEMASVVPLKHTTKPLDLYKAVKVTFK